MISKKCKYALKALTYIASNEFENKKITTGEIAKNERIPRKFLEVILRDLSNNKILRSQRGANGGFNLHKSKNQIKISEIIRIIDGPIAMLPCVSLNYYNKCTDCNPENCKIRMIFENVRDKTLKILNNESIGSLARD